MVALMVDELEKSELLALLAWWRTAGVTEGLEDAPPVWSGRADAVPGADFAWPEPVARSEGGAAPPVPRPVPTRGAAPVAVAETIGREPGPRPVPSGPVRGDAAPPRPPVVRRERAGGLAVREAARKAASLDALEGLLRDFEGCPLKATAKSLCFYRGSPAARVMVIGEAPGRDEDLAGKPFVGRAGQLLDRMLAAIGLGEADVHITNIVYWRPPGNRTPTPEEAQACRPFLDRQIELVEPEFILTMGGPAAKAMLDATDGILKLRGRWREIAVGGRTVRVMPTLHPAYLLRQPDAKRQAWRDLVALKVAMDGAGSS